jgi:hypothetical protein
MCQCAFVYSKKNAEKWEHTKYKCNQMKQERKTRKKEAKIKPIGLKA